MNTLHNVGKQVSSFELYDQLDPITGIALVVDNEDAYFAGYETGTVLDVYCPYGTQEMANTLLSQLRGQVYAGFRAENAILSPAAELGDWVTVNGGTYMLAYRSVTFGPGHMSEIAAPGESTQEHEYGWPSPETRKFDYELNKTRSMISKTNDEIMLAIYGEDGKGGLSGQMSTIRLALGNVSSKVQGLDGAYSQIDQKVNNLSFKVVGVDGKETSVKLSDGKIDLQGLVTISSLGAGGTTEIDAGRIKTGYISAERINVDDLRVQTIWGDAIRKAIVCESQNIHIGGSEGVEFSNVNIRGGAICFRKWHSTGGLDIDPLLSQIKPVAKEAGSVGTSALPFGSVHCKVLYLDGTLFSPSTLNKLQYDANISAELNSLKRFVPAAAVGYSLGSSDKPWEEARVTRLYVNGVQTREDRVTQGTANYVELNSDKQFVPSSSLGYSLGSDSRPWADGYFTKLHVGTSEVSPSKLTNGAAVYVELNGSKAFVPGGATGYSLGSAALPWAEARVSKLYIGTAEVKAVPSRIGYSATIYADMKAGKDFTPSGTGYSLGSSSMAWDNCYLGSGTIKIGANALASGTKIGFYGAAPVARQTLSTTSKNMGYTSVTSSNYLIVLSNIVGILKKMGLIAA